MSSRLLVLAVLAAVVLGAVASESAVASQRKKLAELAWEGGEAPKDLGPFERAAYHGINIYNIFPLAILAPAPRMSEDPLGVALPSSCVSSPSASIGPILSLDVVANNFINIIS